MDRCTGSRDITEILLETALNTILSVSQSIDTVRELRAQKESRVYFFGTGSDVNQSLSFTRFIGYTSHTTVISNAISPLTFHNGVLATFLVTEKMLVTRNLYFYLIINRNHHLSNVHFFPPIPLSSVDRVQDLRAGG